MKYRNVKEGGRVGTDSNTEVAGGDAVSDSSAPKLDLLAVDGARRVDVRGTLIALHAGLGLSVAAIARLTGHRHVDVELRLRDIGALMAPRGDRSVSEYPLLASEAFRWNPRHYRMSDVKELEWECWCGHHWVASPRDRAAGAICPSCGHAHAVIWRP